MAQKYGGVISATVRTVKYFSIIVDSTCDISHIDQLSIFMRYVQECGTPTNVFLIFVPNTGHKCEELYTSITNSLAFLEINLDDCRANCTIMLRPSGACTDLQARIKNANKFTEFILSSVHSLNLIKISAASSNKSTNYFTFFCKKLSTFFGIHVALEKLKKKDV